MKKLISEVALRIYSDGTIEAATRSSIDWTTLSFGFGDDIEELVKGFPEDFINQDEAKNENNIPFFTVGEGALSDDKN